MLEFKIAQPEHFGGVGCHVRPPTRNMDPPIAKPTANKMRRLLILCSTFGRASRTGHARTAAEDLPGIMSNLSTALVASDLLSRSTSNLTEQPADATRTNRTDLRTIDGQRDHVPSQKVARGLKFTGMRQA